MIKRYLFIILLIIILSSCGIPKDTQELMNQSIYNQLSESFQKDSEVLPIDIEVELSKIRKTHDNEMGDYEASFLFSFHNFWDNAKYNVRGVAYFDSYGFIVKKDGTKNIIIYVISKNYELLSSDEIHQLRPKDTIGW